MTNISNYKLLTLVEEVEHILDSNSILESKINDSVEKTVAFFQEQLNELKEKRFYDFPLFIDVLNRSHNTPVVFRFEDHSIGVYLPKIAELYQEIKSAKQFVFHLLSLLAYELGKAERYFSSKEVYVKDLSHNISYETISKCIFNAIDRENRIPLEDLFKSSEFIKVFSDELDMIYTIECSHSLSIHPFVSSLNEEFQKYYNDLFSPDVEKSKNYMYQNIEDYLKRNYYSGEKLQFLMEILKEATNNIAISF